MAVKKRPGADDFVLVNVIYEDGAQRSNRKVPLSDLSGFDDETDIRTSIEAQDRKIAELAGQSRGPIKAIVRVKQKVS
jgi:hypothetical protein